MKLNVLENVLDYENKPILDGEKNLTWRLIISQALNTLLEDDKNMSGEDKGKSYLLTMRAYNSDEPDFTIEEKAFILNRIKKIFTPLLVGRANEFFEKVEPVQQLKPVV